MTFVQSCPTTKDTYLKASQRLGCANDTYHHNQYICLPNTEKPSLVEFCNNEIMGIQEKGSCLEGRAGKLIRHSCQNFSMGCPKNDFWEYEYFNYPACQLINTKHQCYVMDPSCPPDDHTEETNNHNTIIFVCSFIFGLLVLIIAAVFFIRKRTNQRYRPEDSEEKNSVQEEKLMKLIAPEVYPKTVNFKVVKKERGLQHIDLSKTMTLGDEMEENEIKLYTPMGEGCLPLCKIKVSRNPRDINSSWKCCMCHFILAVPMENDTYLLLTYPTVCTQEPKTGSVFCEEHHKLLERHQIPTKDFLESKGCAVYQKSANDIKTVDEKLLEFEPKLYESDSTGKALGSSALNY